MKKKNIPFSPPDITEEEIAEVVDSLRSGWITTGPKTKRFEQELSEYTGTNKTVCLNSATAGLELVLRILGVGPGDEVIVPAMTYTASCSVIEHVGATPVIVDIQANHFEMDYEAVEKAITNRTKVIIPVELAGIPCDHDRILEIVENYRSTFVAKTPLQEVFGRIVVLSDSAHAFGAEYKGRKIGSVADFTAFSFHAVKNLTTAEGGAVTWKSHPDLDDEDLYRQFQILSLHGQTKDALAKTKLGAWEYDIILPGFKCNMTDIMASIGLAQLKRYQGLLNRRAEIVATYNQAFEGTRIHPLQHIHSDYVSSMHLYITHIDGITLEERNQIIEKLAEAGIACNVHYKPLPLLTAYANMGFDIKDYPNAYRYFEHTLTLPLHTQLSDEDVEYISENLKEIVASVKGTV
ncbi:aminotransferase class I/II-fold pyridoxal phosphate-dependent enzyme [Streptococcus sp. zg-86]|uniref:Aminotransferase class I/II-fold pyridoxal phosphate-dependent enzyme n=1 Tax=Streptococcus zhangguiae TaxID=2664091 RepID=A0A6I4RJ00_9STRE|nr:MULTISPECIES: DegT/DnrJ/EryC1/StrS family aminotransferase [unclassified Streptococcus]MTB64720.1 aminotransferase class I/II-fold pyridoxal phosphate-dependent enzyme [Streptococcus sp. zg-86]MTB91532.1 aminotransferase class I/II-fold pyridoxal phosphate-dependent enzyme [Streptococcus sp. zg-36]MWV56777.1 aminotransferase class I/II-fold pyridoxal phosphate-dependent enzyme [Streptococcus sp. zg-70]QTH48509.1 DegT/DnrJ/EryC1/StrS family aminotransferase [Streptococcus sp. zg-86]